MKRVEGAEDETKPEERIQAMFRKIVAAVLVVAAILTASTAVPGLLENVAVACQAGVDC